MKDSQSTIILDQNTETVMKSNSNIRKRKPAKKMRFEFFLKLKLISKLFFLATIILKFLTF